MARRKTTARKNSSSRTRNKHAPKKAKLATVFQNEAEDIDEEDIDEEDAEFEAREELEEDLDGEEENEDDDEEFEDRLPDHETVGGGESNSDTVGFDIFEDFAKPLALRGTPIYFLLYKNGSLLARKEFPYTLEQLQSEFGPGVYRIVVKSVAKNTILKSHTIPIAVSGGNVSGNHGNAHGTGAGNGGGHQSLTTAEVLALLNENRAREREEMKAELARDKEQTGGIMQVLAEMQKQSSQQMQLMMTMIMESSKNSTNQLLTLMQAQMASQAARGSEKGMDTLTLIKLLKESESSGQNQMLKLMELAEEKASEKADLEARILEAIEKKGGGEGDKQSSLDRLIQTLAPVVASALAAQQAQPKVAALPPQNVTPLRSVPQALPREVAQPPVRQPVRTPQAVSGKPLVTAPPKANQPKGPAHAEPAQSEETVKTEVQFTEAQKALVNHLLPTIGQWLVARRDVNEAASETVQILAKLGPNAVSTAKTLTEAHLIAARKEHLAAFPIADQWLRPYWKSLSEQVLKAS